MEVPMVIFTFKNSYNNRTLIKDLLSEVLLLYPSNRQTPILQAGSDPSTELSMFYLS